MRRCESIRTLLPLHAGGDLGRDAAGEVDRHLRDCASCSSELETFKSVISEAQRAFPSSHEQAESVRRRIALEAAAGVRGTSFRWLPLFMPAARPAGLVAAAAVVIALVAIPLALRERVAGPETSEQAMKIEVVAEPGAVKLAWSDGPRASYTVYKSDNPRDFGRKDAHVVRGNSWVDRAPDSSPVVFYKIE
ncbi:MAG TPA: zf-HC2 domain-containing protein [Gemmatimonadales bacterium]|nr:zf-HC2 domain-containing protein [Gemmatimonadales bacterium]